MKSKHRQDEDSANAETHEAKRLKFDDENDEDEMENRQDGKSSPCTSPTESSPDVPQSSSNINTELKDDKEDEFSAEDQGMCLILHCHLVYKVTPEALLSSFA